MLTKATTKRQTIDFQNVTNAAANIDDFVKRFGQQRCRETSRTTKRKTNLKFKTQIYYAYTVGTESEVSKRLIHNLNHTFVIQVHVVVSIGTNRI